MVVPMVDSLVEKLDSLSAGLLVGKKAEQKVDMLAAPTVE